MDLSGFELDPLFNLAAQLVIDTKSASVSKLQRRFRIGYSRAATIIEQLELIGVVSQISSEGTRSVLVDSLSDIDVDAIFSKNEEQLSLAQDEYERQKSVANSIDEQIRISAITNKKITIWLKDSGSISQAGNKIYILNSSSPFEYLAKQQKSKIKTTDIEYSDILDGYIFSATMQMKTPSQVLCQHGRVEKIQTHKLPRITKHEGQGCWMPRIKPAEELGLWARDVKGGMASEVGTIPNDGGDFLRFMLFMHQIVENQLDNEEALMWVRSCYDMVGSDGEPIGKYVDHYGDTPEKALAAIQSLISNA